MKKVRPKRRLMFQLILIMLLISLAPLVISDSNLVKLNEEYLENDLLGSHATRARQTAEEVSSYLDNTIEKLEIVARLQPLTRSFSEQQNYQLLVFFLEQYKDLISISLLDEKGATQAEVIRPGLGSVRRKERAALRKSVISEAMEGKVYVSDPLGIPEKNASLLMIGLPIIEGNHVGGVLLADMSLERIWKIIGRITIRRSGEAYLVDRQGRLIAHKDRQRAVRQESMKGEEIVGKYLALGNTGGALPFVDKGGREMLGAYAPLSLEGWGVVVQEPRKDAYSVVAEMKEQIIFWGVVTSILVSIIGLFFARRISVPIMDFTRSALRIAQGNFKEKIKIRSNNEIGQLAETFNFMANQLDLYDQNMRDLFMSAIASLAAAIDERDPYTRGHSERVTEYSMAIADEMGLDPKVKEEVQLAALLHDIGKIGIDDSVLRKPAKLTDEEFRQIQEHPEKGANIMAPIKQLKKIIPAMRHHHERYDGAGYPDGLSGYDIPLAARIISVADTFDAMTSDRPYQAAQSELSVVENLKSWAGSRYDPVVCEAFARAYSKGRIKGWKCRTMEDRVPAEVLKLETPSA
ncbi:MAG: HD domain-containing protein [Deltaproteobacteria bacterium]|nr:HD domain-containing protein [Deltaproteobacteria bacterium]